MGRIILGMAGIARVVAPGFPHHITQRGDRRQLTFFTIDVYRAYLDLMAEWSVWYTVEIWAYCLMANQVHIIAVPQDEDALCNPPSVYAKGQFSSWMAWTSMAGTVCIVSDG